MTALFFFILPKKHIKKSPFLVKWSYHTTFQKGRFFMKSHTNCTTQTTLPLEVIEEKVTASNPATPLFKPYDNRQSTVIFDIQDYIPTHHVARVVDEMVERIPKEQLYRYYSGGGRPAFHPKMMLKVILYAYSQKIYSCRDIEKMTKENLPTMWLAGMQTPDFRTINAFRGKRMKAMMDQLFETMILQLIEDQWITMENYFLDGTKIEANANKYSFVWKKSTVRWEAQLKQRIQETLVHIDTIAAQEELEISHSKEEATAEDLEAIANQLAEKVDALSEAIENTEESQLRKQLRSRRSTLKKPMKQIRENFLPRMEKYQTYQTILGDRNSFSKTDPDATFMRMKEDHMRNGQLKPGYNVQMATENQLIVDYSVHQRPNDTRCFIPHLEKLAASNLPMPQRIIADAGYGSEANYLYAIGEEKSPRFEFLIPYGTYLKEQKRAYKKDIKNFKNWTYRAHEDDYICPNNRRVVFKKYLNRKNRSGYVQSYKIYECESCLDCPLKPQCTKAKGNRQIFWNTIFEEMKAKAKAALESEEEAAIYAQRKVEVESVFGHIKGNRSFRRFSLRGIDKVHTEFGIVAIAHNILKIAELRRLLFRNFFQMKNKKRKMIYFSSSCFILGAYWTAPLF